jgi:hypothetical protein
MVVPIGQVSPESNFMYLFGSQNEPAAHRPYYSMRKSLILLLIVFGFLPLSAICQQAADSSDRLLIQHALRFFYKSIGENSLLYSGKEYLPYEFPTEGHAYLDADQMQAGSVAYEGILYSGIPVQYDLQRDLLIIKYYNPVFRISLFTDRVDSFSVANHHFIRLAPDTLTSRQITPGFYEVLYNRKTIILAKRKKVIEETVTVDKIRRRFLQKDIYYINLNGNYILVKNKANMLDAFSTKKKEISRYLKRNKLRFRIDRDASLIAAAKHYDELTRTDEQ